MSVGLVGFGRLVHVVSSLDRAAGAVGRVDDLAGELVRHRLLVAKTRIGDKPAESQGDLPLGRDLDRDLVVARGAP